VPLEQGVASAGPAATPVSAEQSVKNWLAFRAERNPAPDQDSLANWLAYRESQATAVTTENRSQDHARDPVAGGKGHRDAEPASNNPQRGHKNDLGY
jgi:hypothetical protein